MKLLAAAAVLVALGFGTRGGEPPRVVALDRGGEAVAELRLPESRAFALSYRHSYYRKPAVERFQAERDGSFRLLEISSPSQAVLDYYELEGTRTKHLGWWTLRLARPARFERMGLAATAVGRRTLEAGAARAPLYRGDGRAAHLTIAVEGS